MGEHSSPETQVVDSTNVRPTEPICGAYGESLTQVAGSRNCCGRGTCATWQSIAAKLPES